MQSGGVGLAVVASAAAAGALASSGAVWRGDILWGFNRLDRMAYSVFPALAALAAAAWSAAGGHDLDEVALPARRGATFFRRLAWATGPLLGVWIVAGVVVVLVSMSQGADLRPSLLLVPLVTLLGMVWSLGLGYLAARAVPWPAAVPVAGAVSLLATLLGYTRLSLAGWDGINVGQAPALGQPGVWVGLLTLAVAGAAVAAANLGRATATASLVLAAALVVAAGQVLPYRGLVLDPGARVECSDDARVRLCLFAGYESMREPTERVLTRLVSSAQARGVRLPAEEIRMSVRGAPVPHGVGLIRFEDSDLRAGPVDPERAATALTMPVWCNPRTNPGWDSLTDRGYELQTWLLAAAGYLTPEEAATQAPALRDRTPSEQDRHAAATATGLRACRP